VRVGDRQLTGRILAADADRVVLSAAHTAHAADAHAAHAAAAREAGHATVHELTYDKLGAGKVQLEFARVAALSDDDLEEIPVADDHHDDFEEDEA
jgi:hypothetical protein